MIEKSLSPAAITDNLGTLFIGQRILYYPRLPSTNDIAKHQAQQGAIEGTVVIAKPSSSYRMHPETKAMTMNVG